MSNPLKKLKKVNNHLLHQRVSDSSAKLVGHMLMGIVHSKNTGRSLQEHKDRIYTAFTAINTQMDNHLTVEPEDNEMIELQNDLNSIKQILKDLTEE